VTRKSQYTVSVDDEMFNAIEEFRFSNRFQSRAEATSELIRLGLETLKKQMVEESQAAMDTESQK
jgi:metal-responsive CopG/Arc/MetJ family transcriptional regulator